MTSILAIDTATDICSVAIQSKSTTLLRKSPQLRKHAADVLPMIQSLLDEAGMTLAQLDAIALTSGPGSFTGLRIGTAVAQGLSFGANIPVIRVSSLMMLVRSAFIASRQPSGSTIDIAVCMHAREDEFYFAVYRDDGLSLPAVLLADKISDAASILDHLAGITDTPNSNRAHAAQLHLAGSGWLQPSLRPALDAVTAQHRFTSVSSDAAILCALSQLAFAAGQLESAEQALPVYLKEDMAYRKS